MKSNSEPSLSNWRTSPYNQWSFANVEHLLKTRSIKRADQPSPFFAPASEEKTDNRLETLQGLLEESSTDGFLVLHKGNVATESYAHGNDESTRHIMMSMTKSITSIIVGILVGQGTLDTEAKVSNYVPETKGTPYEDITLRHLLDMRSGIQYDDSSHEYRYATGWDKAYPGEAESDFLAFLSDFHPATKPPGGPFEYLSVNTDVLGLVIERASGRKLPDLVSERIWQPIGAERDALLTVDRLGNPRAAGGMCATVRDLARLGQALIDGHIAPKTWIEDILAGGDKGIFASGTWASMFAPLSKNAAYRSCWVADDEQRLIAAQGIHGQLMVVDLRNEIVMVKTSSQGHPSAELPSGVKMFLEVRKMLST